MDNVGLNSGNCILVTSGNISVKKSPCGGSISFTCDAQMLYNIQLRISMLYIQLNTQHLHQLQML